jgi:hypothetical protein
VYIVLILRISTRTQLKGGLKENKSREEHAENLDTIGDTTRQMRELTSTRERTERHGSMVINLPPCTASSASSTFLVFRKLGVRFISLEYLGIYKLVVCLVFSGC